jgi:hypothetical protein
MKINLKNKVWSMIALASMLSAPIGVAFAEGTSSGDGGEHGGAPSSSGRPSGGHSGNPSEPAPAQPAPTQPNNHPPQHQGPGPDRGGDNNNDGNNNDVGAAIGGAVILGDIIGGIFANVKAVSWDWVEVTDSTGGYTLDCYGYNSKGNQVGKPTDVSKCADVPQPVIYQEQANSDGTQSCYEYYAPNGDATDALNDGNPMPDDSLCADTTANTQ